MSSDREDDVVVNQFGKKVFKDKNSMHLVIN